MRNSVNRNFLSLLACIIISTIFIQHRISFPGINSETQLKLTSWDALGYYLYLPGTFIYHDLKKLDWLEEIDKEYNVVGSSWYQVTKHDNGNYVGKYFIGVSILQLPYFTVGHILTSLTGHKADGFSPPYQYALGFGMLLFCLFSMFLLRDILLRFYTDSVVAVTLLLLLLASNAIQYLAIENGMSHAPIFALYVFVLYTTIRWHESPGFKWAALTGFIIGLATICRPTEAIMILIPIFWDTQSKSSAIQKWNLVKANRNHVFAFMVFGFLGVLPQLIYWQYITGFFIYDVGSAWNFLNPHFRVLFGGEKGWFIYTPVSLLFVLGLFFVKRMPFRKAVIIFCLINIYIVIAWRDWRYGGSYSTRALVQSYPVFSLALAAFVNYLHRKNFHLLLYPIGIYLIFVNLFQIKQYAYNYIHYDHMNFSYYRQIFLKSVPSPLDASLLDTDDWVSNENEYHASLINQSTDDFTISGDAGKWVTIKEIDINQSEFPHYNGQKSYLKFEAVIETHTGIAGSFLLMNLVADDSTLSKQIRLFSPTSSDGSLNQYASYIHVPSYFINGKLRFTVKPALSFEGTLKEFKVTALVEK